MGLVQIPFTIYENLYDVEGPRPVCDDWPALVARFSLHLRTPDKYQAPVFGPHVLTDLPRPCAKHNSTAPHRCNDSVATVTMAVFDADEGTAADLATTDDLLGRTARLWYSSHSYRPDSSRPAFRLVIPLSRPVPKGAWRNLRLQIATRFRVPANLVKCAAPSHAYFTPSCPPDADPVFDVHDGPPLEVDEFRVIEPPAEIAVDWEPPPEPDGPIDTGPLRTALERRIASLARRPDPRDQDKAQLLQNCLRGNALATHGNRNNATLLVAGMVAYAAPPGTPASVMHRVMRPSVDAMIAAGSTLTHTEVERMILSAMRNRADAEAREDGIRRLFEKVRAEIPTAGS